MANNTSSEANVTLGFGTIVLISILIFFFKGDPDNWDKLDAIIDNQYQELEKIKEPKNNKNK